MPVLAELDWVTMGMLADRVEAQAGVTAVSRQPLSMA